MNGAAGIFSHPTRGAGIYMYWLMDEDALNLSLDKLDDAEKIMVISNFLGQRVGWYDDSRGL